MVQINGFIFEEEAQAVKARREADGISYIRQKINLDDPEKALQIYNKMVQERVFETPVGYAFLHELQEELNMAPYIKKTEIMPIEVLSVPQEAKQEGKNEGHEKKDASDKTARNVGNRKKEAKKSKEFRARFIVSLIINIMLAAAVAVMIAVSYIGENVTVLNYENKLIDRYEQWEQELDEREKAVSEYEKKYDINKEK